MDFRGVCDFFGGSIFYEECRCDVEFGPTIDRIERYETTQAKDDKDLEYAREVLRIVLVTLRGQTKDAMQLATRKRDEASKSGLRNWSERFNAYAYYACVTHYYPPLFRGHLQKPGPSGFFREPELGKCEKGAPYHYVIAFKDILKRDPPAEEAKDQAFLEKALMYALWWLNHHALRAAQFPVVYLDSDDGYKPLFFATMDLLVLLQRQFRLIGMPKISNYANRLFFELGSAMRDPDIREFLSQLRTRYQADEDHVGVAICDILDGDLLVSGPLSNPLMLNMPLVEGWVVGPSLWPESGLDSIVKSQYDGKIEYESADCNSETRLYRTKKSYMVPTIDMEKVSDNTKPWFDIHIKWRSKPPHVQSEKSSDAATDSTGSAGVQNSPIHESDGEGQDPEADDGGSESTSLQEPKLSRGDAFVSLTNLEKAKVLFQNAHDLFQAHGTRRGCAVIKLRLACLEVLTELHEMAPTFRYLRRLNRCSPQFEEATEALKATGDSMCYYLALLLQFLCGRPSPELWDIMGRIAVPEGNSDIFIQQLGLLALRYGTFNQYRLSQSQAAHSAYLASRTILSTLNKVNKANAEVHMDFLGIPMPIKVFSEIEMQRTSIALAVQSGLSDICHRINMGWSLVPKVLLADLCDELITFSAAIIDDKERVDEADAERTAAVCLSSLQVYLETLWQIALSSKHFQEDAENWLRSATTETTKNLERFPHLAERVGVMRERGLALADTFRLQRLVLSKRSTTTKESYGQARHELFLHGGEVARKHELWPWSIALAAQILEQCGLLDQMSKLSALLEVQPLWPKFNGMEEVLANDMFAWHRVVELEHLLETSISLKSWAYGADIVQILAKLVPGYMTRFACGSTLPHWRRAWFISAVEYGIGHIEQAFNYSLASMAELEMTRLGEFDTGDSRSRYFSHSDMNRPANLCAKIMIDASMSDTQLVSVSTSSPELEPYGTKGQFSFIDGHEYFKEKSWYNAHALFYLERAKAMSISDTIKLSKAPIPADALSDWASRSRKKSLFHALQLATRPLTQEEQHELNNLEEESKEFLWTTTDLDEDPGDSKKDPASQSVVDFEYLPGNAMVIHTGMSREGLNAVILSWTGIHESFTASVDILELEGLISAYLLSIRENKGSADLEELLYVSYRLSELLIRPFEKWIDAMDHIIFVPSGPLAQFPLGALLFKDEYLIEQKAVSQVPSLAYLHHVLSKEKSRENRKPYSVVVRPGSAKEELLGGEAALPLAGFEAVFATGFKFERAKQATDVKRADLANIFDSDIVHIATHGYVDADAPLLSRISLGEPTRVVDLTNTRSTADIVVFSACNSATGMETPGNDVIGFSHTLLSAGSDLFVGSLWPTEDLVTLIHMMLFYSGWWNEDINAAVTWQRATKRLMGASVSSVENFLQELIDMWDHWEERGRSPGKYLGKNGKVHVERLMAGLKDVDGNLRFDLSHPYYWAPFVFVGYSETRLRMEIPEG